MKRGKNRKRVPSCTAIPSEAVKYLIAEPARTEPHRNKPNLSIGSGFLIIEDCGCNKVMLNIESAKELHRLLPGLISILEPLCSGNGAFTFGHIP